MKLKVDDYEITISAKYKNSPRATKEDTGFILNSISIWATEASERYRRMGAYALADEAEKVGKEIYQYLEGKGFYKRIP